MKSKKKFSREKKYVNIKLKEIKLGPRRGASKLPPPGDKKSRGSKKADYSRGI